MPTEKKEEKKIKENKDLTDILQDFGKITKEAFKLRKEEDTVKDDPLKRMSLAISLLDLIFYDKQGNILKYGEDDKIKNNTIDSKDVIVWFEGYEGEKMKLIGKPQDYLEIRNDFNKIKEFLGRTLDKGRVYYGTSYWNQDGETNTANYVAWLYKNCENETFKKNFEKATIELLTEELNKKFAPFDYESGMKKAEGDFTKFYDSDVDKLYYLNGDSIDSALWRIRLDYLNTKEMHLKEYFEKEFKKIAKKDKDGRERICFADASSELKEALKKRWFEIRANEYAISNFTPQFNRLIGLFDVFFALGKHNAGFAEAYKLLKQKAQEGFFKDAPNLVYHFTSTNIFRDLLFTLSAVQKGTELKEFWLDNIKNDSNIYRIYTSVHGLLNSYNSKEERKKQIPLILERLKQRGYDIDHTFYYSVITGFLDDANLLNELLNYITSSCFEKEVFHNFDKNSVTLDVVEEIKIGNGRYDFKFLRVTPNETKGLNTTYDLIDNKIIGNTELENSIKAYFDEGYPIPKDITVTSLEGRLIKDNIDTNIVESKDKVKNLYEGIIGINNNYFPFVYDEEKDTLLVAEPYDSQCVLFGVKDNWKERRMGLGKIKKKIPYSQFVSLSEVGKNVNHLVAQKRRAGIIGDSLYSLKGKLLDEISPYLTTIIKARLIKYKDGLIE